MRWARARSGVAALEMALLAPLLVTLMLVFIDFAAAFLDKARITRAVQNAAQYATAAGHNNVAPDSLISGATTIAQGVTSSFLGVPTVTTVINQDPNYSSSYNSSYHSYNNGSKCCLGTGTWSCSISPSLTCSDGSTPGVYITVTAQYPFTALFPLDTYLFGTTLSERIVARLQ